MEGWSLELAGLDDFFIVAKTRWPLRKAVRALNGYFTAYGFTQHPDKTFIGPTCKGIDWMGYWLTNQGCQSVAPRALRNHLTKLHRKPDICLLKCRQRGWWAMSGGGVSGWRPGYQGWVN